MDENGGGGEQVFQSVEGNLSHQGPGEGASRGGELGLWDNKLAVVSDEPPVEVGKAQELLKLLAGYRSLLVHHRLDLSRIWPKLFFG